MSRAHKLLSLIGVALLVGAEVIKHRQFSEKTTLVIGLVEVLTAIGIGIAFGITRRQDEGR